MNVYQVPSQPMFLLADGTKIRHRPLGMFQVLLMQCPYDAKFIAVRCDRDNSLVPNTEASLRSSKVDALGSYV